MVEIADIQDEDSLRSYLRTRPEHESLWMAHRAALRVLPLWGCAMDQAWAQEPDFTALPLLRCCLISTVARKLPTVEITAAAAAADAAAEAAATSAAADAAATSAAADAAAYDITVAAAYYAISATYHAAIYAATYAISAATSAATAAADAAAAANAAASASVFWNAVRQDLRRLKEGAPPPAWSLWPGGVPTELQDAEDRMLAIWAADSPDRWDFWRRFWTAEKAGNSLNPEMLLAVVQEVEDDIWYDPDAVAADIKKIEARFGSKPGLSEVQIAQASAALEKLITENPHAWRIEINPKSGLYQAHAIKQRDLSGVVGDVRAAVTAFNRRCRTIKVGNFGQAAELAFAPVITELRGDLNRYKGSPYSLYKAINYARAEMVEIGEAEGFLGESYITRFFKTLDDLASEVCVNAPEVVEQLKKQSDMQYELWTIEKKQDALRQTFGLHLDAEGILKRVSLEALRTLSNPEASDEQKKDAFYFCKATLPRAAQAYLAARQDIDGDMPEDSPSRAKGFAELVDLLTKGDKAIDILQENIPEAHGFASEIIQKLASGG